MRFMYTVMYIYIACGISLANVAFGQSNIDKLDLLLQEVKGLSRDFPFNTAIH